MDNDRARGVAKGGVSVIQGEELLLNRIISRNSSFGCSSRIYYYRSSEGIPFDWEMQPGTPKEPQKEDILPPLSPPPAVLSVGLPKPCINMEEPKPLKLRAFMFWKQGKKKQGNKKLDQAGLNASDQSHKYSNCEMCSSDDEGEFMASPRMSSSSSSSSFSFSNGVSFRSSSLELPNILKLRLSHKSSHPGGADPSLGEANLCFVVDDNHVSLVLEEMLERNIVKASRWLKLQADVNNTIESVEFSDVYVDSMSSYPSRSSSSASSVSTFSSNSTTS
ncbi:hypothetical protein DITRI_Ditri10aG0183000 [Diplodiscus trichospermus]